MPAPLIHCTAKLAKLLKLKPAMPLPDADGWNANLFPIAGRKCIILTNKATFFSLIKFDVLKPDLNDFPTFFHDLLKEQLHCQWPMHGPAIEAWLNKMPSAALTGSDNDKRTIGVMNRFVDEFMFNLDWFGTPLMEPNMRVANWNLNNNIVGGGKARHAIVNPEQEMARLMVIPYDREDADKRYREARKSLEQGHMRII